MKSAPVVRCKLFTMQIALVALVTAAALGCGGGTGPAGPAGAAGATGATGSSGSTGATGATGSAGTNNHFTAGIGCFGTIAGLTGAAGTALNGLVVKYQADLTSAGDVFATASIDTGGLQISGTSFYSSVQNGATNASVLITADFATANGGYWNITLNRSTLVATAVYTDSTLAGQSPVTINFLASACTLISF